MERGHPYPRVKIIIFVKRMCDATHEFLRNADKDVRAPILQTIIMQRVSSG